MPSTHGKNATIPDTVESHHQMGELKRRGRVWWIRYSRNGHRYEESAHSDKKEDATRLLRLREGDMARGVPVTPTIGRLRFEDAAADVVLDYQINGKRSLKVLNRRITKHLAPFFGGRRMAGITTADVRAFVAHRQAQTIIVRPAHWVTLKSGKTFRDSNGHTNAIERRD